MIRVGVRFKLKWVRIRVRMNRMKTRINRVKVSAGGLDHNESEG